MLDRIDCFGTTNVGRVRQSNQDQFLIADLQKSMRVVRTSLQLDHQSRLFGRSQGRLFVVADGMGGHAAGEYASSLAIDCAVDYLLSTRHVLLLLQDDGANEDALCHDLREAFDRCQTRFAAEIEAAPDRRGMGTTLTLAYVVWPRLYVVHVGDSRAYLFRNGQLTQITTDHTVAQHLADEGYLSPSEVKTSQLSHVLWNAIGDASFGGHPEFYRDALRINDMLLLCTDGLTRHVSDERIAEVLQQDRSAEAMCEELTAGANEAGGMDNITTIVARFVDVPS